MRAVLAASVVAAVLAFGAGADAAPPAVGTLDLGAPVFTGQTARMDLLLTFESGNPADTIELIEPSVYGSDLGSGPLLNPLDPAFGRFGFDLGPDLTTRNWQELDPMGGGLSLFLEMVATDPAAPLPLAPGSTYDVGTLLLDLTGIPAGSPVTVTLADGTIPLTNTDLAGAVDGVATSFAPGTNNDDTDPAWLVFADPDGVTFQAPGGLPDGEPIPEPAAFLILALGLGSLSTRAHHRR
ncbi:MAG: hypothetical protein R6V58_05750 [Planctomycetota bacterium]